MLRPWNWRALSPITIIADDDAYNYHHARVKHTHESRLSDTHDVYMDDMMMQNRAMQLDTRLQGVCVSE